jgi:hypothetical protein
MHILIASLIFFFFLLFPASFLVQNGEAMNATTAAGEHQHNIIIIGVKSTSTS